MKHTFTKLFSFLALLTTVSLYAEEVVTVQLCEPGTVLFGCEQFSAAGVYQGVDVGGQTKTLNLLIGAPSPASTVNASIEQGNIFLFGCDQLTAAGDYTTTFTNASGCDSIVTLHLALTQPCVASSYAYADSVVLGQSYLLGCQTITPTQVGTADYVETIPNACGSDSVITLTLKVLPACAPTAYAYTDSIVLGETYLLGCQTITPTQVGTADYVETIPNACGSDSVITLTLKVLPACAPTAYAYTDSIVLGETYLLGCQTITPTQVGTADYVETIPNACGMDSVITLTLKVLPACAPTAYAYTDSIVLGETYLLGCQTITPTQVGTADYVETIPNACGMDSVITLTLKVLPACPDPITVPLLDTVICAADTATFMWQGRHFNVDGEYYDTVRYVGKDCDSAYFSLRLKINMTMVAPIESDTICGGDSYDWVGHTGYNDLTETGVYKDTLRYPNGCDSIYFTLHLTVLTAIDAPMDTKTICAGDSYDWPEHPSFTNLTVDSTYRDTLKYKGTVCDSIRYTLRLKVQTAVAADAETATFCAGDSYNWVGHAAYANLTEEGVYKDTARYTTGCDSVYYQLTLTVQSAVTADAEEATICAGDSYEWVGHAAYANLTEEGVYKDTARYTTGCDSVYYMLKLTVQSPVTADVETVTICAGDSYDWVGHTGYNDLTNEGTYKDTARYTTGCDSVYYMLKLTVQNPVTADAETANICAGDSYNWVGHAAFANLTEAGVYKDTARYTTGCDSVYYQLKLTKQSPVTADAEEATICAGEAYNWVGHAAYANLTEAGVYKDTARYITGCDSVYYQLTLTVQSAVTADAEEATICSGDAYNWVGHAAFANLTEAGVYKDTARYTTGCDSVYYQLTLTVNPSYSDITDARTVCGSELPYTWNGVQFDAPGTKTATLPTILGCDSVITMTLDTFIFDLPANISVDDVVAICGKAIDVTEAQQQVEAHIQLTTGYAPNATVAWYQLQGGLWVAMSTTAIEPGKDEITLRYAITSDCGTIYSANLIIPVQTPSADNIPEMDNLPALEKYGDRLLMIHRRRIRETYGFDPTPEQVTWYKVTGAVDTLGKITDDTEIGHGYYYTADAVLRGEFYAVIEETPAPTSCGAIYRTERIICEPEDAPARVRKVCQDERLYIIVTDENGRETIYDATGRLVESLHAK